MTLEDETNAGDAKDMSQQMGSIEIDDLVSQMEQSADDPRRCYALVKERIATFKKSGIEVPTDLVKLEKSLMTECMLASQGR